MDTRLWMYRRDEARLFAHRDHVPHAEGWQRFPVQHHDPYSRAADTAQPRHKIVENDAVNAPAVAEHVEPDFPVNADGDALAVASPSSQTLVPSLGSRTKAATISPRSSLSPPPIGGKAQGTADAQGTPNSPSASSAEGNPSSSADTKPDGAGITPATRSAQSKSGPEAGRKGRKRQTALKQGVVPVADLSWKQHTSSATEASHDNGA